MERVKRPPPLKVVLGEPDELVHNMTLRLDATNDIPWSLAATDDHNLTLRFCTTALIERRECQCPADVAALPEVTVGSTAARWGDVVCVKRSDVDAVDVQQVRAYICVYVCVARSRSDRSSASSPTFAALCAAAQPPGRSFWRVCAVSEYRGVWKSSAWHGARERERISHPASLYCVFTLRDVGVGGGSRSDG